jgi:hypothetical protein
MSKEIISSLYKTQFFKDIEVSEVNQTLKKDRVLAQFVIICRPLLR